MMQPDTIAVKQTVAGPAEIAGDDFNDHIAQAEIARLDAESTRHLVATYNYLNADGTPFAVVERYETPAGKKSFWPMGPGRSKLPQGPRPVYGLPDLLAHPDAPVLVAEGEKVADVLRVFLEQRGQPGVVLAWMGGSGAVEKTDWAPLRGRNVTLCPDADEPGKKAMDKLSGILTLLGGQVRRVAMPAEAEPGDDFADLLAEDRGDDVLRLIGEAEEVRVPATGFRLLRLGDLPLRPPRWIIRDVLELDSLNDIFGDPASCKTFILIDWLACVATGTPWHGFPIKDPGPVILILGEGMNGIRRRFEAWARDHGIDLSRAPIFISAGPVALVEPDLMARVEATIAEVSKVYGPPKIVAIDTWARCLGGDENAPADTGLGIAALDRIRVLTDAAIVAVHHSGNAEKQRARGHSSFKGAMDSEIQATRGQDGMVRLAWTKAKDTRPPEPLAFRLDDVDIGMVDDDGRTIGSAVLHRVEFKEDRAPRALGTNQAAALDSLRTLASEYARNLELDGRTSDGRVRMEDWRSALMAGGLKRNRIHEIVTSLSNAGKIEIVAEWVRLL